MIAEELGRLLFTHGLELLEEIDHCLGIVAAVVQDLRAHEISLALRVAGIFQEERIQTESNAKLAQDRAHGTGSKYSSENRERRLCDVGSGNLMRAVAKNDVADLVRHDACDLGVIIGCFDCSPVDIDKAARQRECVDRCVVYDLELKGILLVGRRM